MATPTKKEPLGKPRQVRFPKDVEKDLNDYAAAEEIEFTQAVRKAARVGAKILKDKLAEAVQQAA